MTVTHKSYKLLSLSPRLSTFYLLYFGALGALVPYWSLYLHERGMRSDEIGELLAILSVTRIISPNVWGYLSDYLGTRMPIVRVAMGLAAASFSMVLVVRGFWGLAVVMAIFSFFWNAALPQMEATVIDHMGMACYGRIRLWGSVGFIAAVLLLGPLLDHFSIQVLPWMLLLFYIGLWLSSLAIPEATAFNPSASEPTFSRILASPKVVVFLLVCFMMQASHGPYYTFYSIYLESHGNSRSLISALWALGVLCEVGVFLVVGSWLSRYGAIKFLRIALLLATIRWILIGSYADSLLILIFTQGLHAATFGVYHASAIHIVHHYFSGRHQARGQALYSSLGYGAGGMAGSLYSGYLWDWLGPSGVFDLGGAISAAALVILWRFYHHENSIL